MNQDRIIQILLAPHISEKSTIVADKNRQHVFRVVKSATKQEVKRAVELMFDVKVDAVQLLNNKGKKKRFNQEIGRRQDWKKAYVRLAEGNDIDFGATD